MGRLEWKLHTLCGHGSWAHAYVAQKGALCLFSSSGLFAWLPVFFAPSFPCFVWGLFWCLSCACAAAMALHGCACMHGWCPCGMGFQPQVLHLPAMYAANHTGARLQNPCLLFFLVLLFVVSDVAGMWRYKAAEACTMQHLSQACRTGPKMCMAATPLIPCGGSLSLRHLL